MRTRTGKLRVVLIAGLALAGSAFQCDRVATIRYTQLATCGTYQYGQHNYVGGPDLIFLIYRIDAIENTAPQAATFAFDPANFRTGSPSAPAPPASAVSALTTATARSIAPGQTVSPVGRLAIPYHTANPAAAAGRRVNLYYTNYPNITVITNRADPIQNLPTCNDQNTPQ